jgi:hypothetical protein
MTTLNYQAMEPLYVNAKLKEFRLSTEGTREDCADRLDEHFRSRYSLERLQCDICGGTSTDLEDHCPFCGDGGTVNPIPIARVKGDIDDRAVYGQDDLDRMCAKVNRLMLQSGRAMRRFGQLLQFIRDNDLWRLVADEKGRQKYPRYREWLKGETPFSNKSAIRFIRMAYSTTDKEWEQLFPELPSLFGIVPLNRRFPRGDKIVKPTKGVIRKDRKQGRIIELLPREPTNDTEIVNLEREDGALCPVRVRKDEWTKPRAMSHRPIDSNKATVQLGIGIHRTELKARTNDAPAKSIDDDPYFELQLSGEVTLAVRIRKSFSGSLEAICETTLT